MDVGYEREITKIYILRHRIQPILDPTKFHIQARYVKKIRTQKSIYLPLRNPHKALSAIEAWIYGSINSSTGEKNVLRAFLIRVWAKLPWRKPFRIPSIRLP